MAKLTKQDIEIGEIKLITKTITDKTIITYNVIYEINDVRYRFGINGKINNETELKSLIYDKLLTTEKINIPSVKVEKSVEVLTNLIGQNVIVPTQER